MNRSKSGARAARRSEWRIRGKAESIRWSEEIKSLPPMGDAERARLLENLRRLGRLRSEVAEVIARAERPADARIARQRLIPIERELHRLHVKLGLVSVADQRGVA